MPSFRFLASACCGALSSGASGPCFCRCAPCCPPYRCWLAVLPFPLALFCAGGRGCCVPVSFGCGVKVGDGSGLKKASSVSVGRCFLRRFLIFPAGCCVVADSALVSCFRRLAGQMRAEPAVLFQAALVSALASESLCFSFRIALG